jgi:hypothetical protein
VAVVWGLVALALRVYPIPTTYLTKVRTGELGLFSGGSFYQRLFRNVDIYFGIHTRWIAVTCAGLLAAVLALKNDVFRWSVVVLAGAFFLLRDGPGNYLWYHENMFIAVLAVSLSYVLFSFQRRRWWIAVVGILICAVPVLTFSKSLGRNRTMTWDFRAEHSRGLSYEAVGEHSAGGGLFQFPGLEPCLMRMDEIGIASYFAGSDSWIRDQSGLAQPAALRGVTDHPLARFYPRSVLRSPDESRRIVLEKLGAVDRPPPEFMAYGDPSAGFSSSCDQYFPDNGVCLMRVGHR